MQQDKIFLWNAMIATWWDKLWEFYDGIQCYLLIQLASYCMSLPRWLPTCYFTFTKTHKTIIIVVQITRHRKRKWAQKVLWRKPQKPNNNLLRWQEIVVRIGFCLVAVKIWLQGNKVTQICFLPQHQNGLIPQIAFQGKKINFIIDS